MNRIIGVAGKICSGKNELTAALRACGFHEIDVDAVGHTVLTEQSPAIEAAFGSAVMASDGTVNRRVLGRIVFADADALRTLEQIVHPRMVETIRSQIQRMPADQRIVINAALLFHMGLHTLCDHAVVVKAWAPVRFLRAWRRDKNGLRDTIARFRRQRSLSLSAERVDISIVGNSTTRSALQRRVARLLRNLQIDC